MSLKDSNAEYPDIVADSTSEHTHKQKQKHKDVNTSLQLTKG